MPATPLGTLLPLTSLKSFSAQLDFLRWLEKTKQNTWLMLPISKPINTPYRNYGIGYSATFLDSKTSAKEQMWLLDRQEFLLQNQGWLLDYALHQALSEHFGTDAWWTWPKELHQRKRTALNEWRLRLEDRLGFFIDQQYSLANQMAILRQEAQNRQITLAADLPFYLAQESPLVWTNQDCFLLRQNGDLRIQSGVPADKDEPFTAQFWGHPLYDWQGVELSKIIHLFNLRLDFLSSTFDLVRLDHANGFFRYGIMYPDHPQWNKKVPGPGKKALNLILEHAQTLSLGIFFESIGSQTMRLEQYMKETGVAGMMALTLAYNLDGENLPTPSRKVLNLNNYRGRQVIFTSTHDTVTLLTWLKSLPCKIKTKFLQINDFSPDLTDEKLAQKIIHRLSENKAALMIVPWQDWHGEEFRFNVPGREDLANWQKQISIKKYL